MENKNLWTVFFRNTVTFVAALVIFRLLAETYACPITRSNISNHAVDNHKPSKPSMEDLLKNLPYAYKDGRVIKRRQRCLKRKNLLRRKDKGKPKLSRRYFKNRRIDL
ncbi:uncharacterized protein LOC130647455 isoform X2 [Hydractinia symbiolongicarpus]|uniref:uncharacterized protein LOC130647455 isoform X2 n=1 Tax=Hydractinia symbiolongicarpus TaxID=13093 RepID=UPI00254F1E64|nr:uncharacterized protein LOC130647455 isoform X2 [Hydractinia symbiolongicarpus]